MDRPPRPTQSEAKLITDLIEERRSGPGRPQAVPWAREIAGRNTVAVLRWRLGASRGIYLAAGLPLLLPFVLAALVPALLAPGDPFANVGPAFVELGFAPERTAKILAKEGAHLKKQPAFKRHIG